MSHLSAVREPQLEAKKLDHHAPLYTLRRSIVISTWSGAALLRHLTKHRP